MFFLCVLRGPTFMYRGSLERFVFGRHMMVDEWSRSLIFLSLWLGGLFFLVSRRGGRGLCVWLVILSRVSAFSRCNLLCFYMFFELALIPMCVLIAVWGVQPERVSAIFYMFIFTIAGSLPFLLFLLAV